MLNRRMDWVKSLGFGVEGLPRVQPQKLKPEARNFEPEAAALDPGP